MNRDNVRREDWIVGGLALMLAIFLFVLPWFDWSLSVGPFTASATFSATDHWDGWLAILGAIAALAVVADVAIERLSPQTQVPAIGGGRDRTRFILAVIAAGFVFLKFLFHIHFTGDLSFAWGFYVIVVVTAALVYFAAQSRDRAPARRSRPSRRAASPRSRRAAPPPHETAGTAPGPSGRSTEPRRP